MSFNLKEEAKKLGINITEDMIEQFNKYESEMLEYNKFVNLTAITEHNEVLEKHFLDSVSALISDKFSEGCSMIDIGAGAGFPSVPLKIVRKDIKLTMLDSLNKRITFLEKICDILAFKDAKAIHMRAEEAGKNKNMRESYDIAVSRAVADMKVLAEFALPLVNVGGYFIALKGNDPSAELEEGKTAIKALGGKTEKVIDVNLPSGIKHTLVIVKKTEKTPSKYPRKAGKPAKEPIV